MKRMGTTSLRGLGTIVAIGLGTLLTLGAAAMWATSASPTASAGEPSRTAADTPHGSIAVDNHTGHEIHVSYRKEHDEHTHSLGHVAAGHRLTFNLPDCNHNYHFHASGHDQSWSTERHVDCGHVVAWQVGGHH